MPTTTPGTGPDAGATTDAASASPPLLRIRDATLTFGERTLWSGLDLDVEPGEVIAIIGANGSGKSSLLKCILGLQPLSAGSVELEGVPVSRGGSRIGYVPQQNLTGGGPGIRGRDLVALGLDGGRFGLPWPSRARRRRVDELIRDVEAESFADRRLAELSGGEQQRLRMAQALAAEPLLLLCDEPLLSLDLPNQERVVGLIDDAVRTRHLASLFVTHDINPVLPIVTRVLYLADGRFRIGTPDEVFRSEVLSELYGSPVEVLRAHGRIIVVGTDGELLHHADPSHDGAHHGDERTEADA